MGIEAKRYSKYVGRLGYVGNYDKYLNKARSLTN